MNFLVSKKKANITIIMIIIIAIQGFFSSAVISGEHFSSTDERLVVVSVVCSISFFVEVILWWKFTGTFFSPYMILFIVLFIFTCGQSIGWATGFDIGDKNLWDRVDHGLNHLLLIRGLSYSMLSVSCFHLGAILSYKVTDLITEKVHWSEDEVTSAFATLGKLMFIICVPAFMIKTVYDVSAVSSGGYTNYYVVNSSRSWLMSVISILADYYQPCMLILLIAHKDCKMYRRTIVCAMLVDVVFSLYIGGRSGAVMTLLGILLAYHYFITPFRRKHIVMGGVTGYIFVAFLNGLATIRGMASRGITDMVSVMGSSFTNVIGEFVGELGWTLTSICWTMNLVPSSYPFRYGMSYLVSLISWIPSVFFGGRANHPAVIWANLSDWLTEVQNMSYGSGYTMVAESYINYGWFGIIAMIIEGFIIAKFIAKVSLNDISNNMFGATFQILVIMMIMKSLVRSSLSVALRSCVFILIPLYFILRYVLERGRKS